MFDVPVLVDEGPTPALENRRAVRVFAPAPDAPVRVRFEIGTDGKFQVTLLEGTGDPARDGQILALLQTWRWEPALRGGRPAASIEVFRLP